MSISILKTYMPNSTNINKNKLIEELKKHAIDVSSLRNYLRAKVKEDEEILNNRPDKYHHLEFIKQDGGIVNTKLLLISISQHTPSSN